MVFSFLHLMVLRYDLVFDIAALMDRPSQPMATLRPFMVCFLLNSCKQLGNPTTTQLVAILAVPGWYAFTAVA